jgi:octaprenyl-diphosphate synthase
LTFYDVSYKSGKIYRGKTSRLSRMQIKDVFKRYKQDLRTVEQNLDQHYGSYITLIPEITNHIIHSGGKRLRPLLLMISSDLCGYKGDRRYGIAAVLEFLHTASLLHDDVIDLADTRRGKTAANHIWGNSASILVGDYLYSQAFKLMVQDGDPLVQKILTDAAITMVEGETAQLTKCGDISITEEEYLRVIEQKTAILISAACAMGAILAKAPQEHIEALSQFGMNLGIAFQVTDDTLDYVATEEEFGKAIGKDFQEGNITLPLIRTLHMCSAAEADLIKKTLESIDSDGNDMSEIMSLLNKYQGIDYALNKASDYINEGKMFLERFEDSEAKNALLAMSDYIVGRRL